MDKLNKWFRNIRPESSKKSPAESEEHPKQENEPTVDDYLQIPKEEQEAAKAKAQKEQAMREQEAREKTNRLFEEAAQKEAAAASDKKRASEYYSGEKISDRLRPLSAEIVQGEFDRPEDSDAITGLEDFLASEVDYERFRQSGITGAKKIADQILQDYQRMMKSESNLSQKEEASLKKFIEVDYKEYLNNHLPDQVEIDYAQQKEKIRDVFRGKPAA